MLRNIDDIFHDLLDEMQTSNDLESFACGKPLVKKSRKPASRAAGKSRSKHAPTSARDDDAHRGEEHHRDQDQDSTTAAIRIVSKVVEHCRNVRQRCTSDPKEDSDMSAELSKQARFTDGIALESFQHFLNYVPRLVNVVTLAEAFPIPGSGVKLPLDLNFIATRCTGAYFAPKRFSAVQLAYTNPRARVLIFHTGRLVGTGTSGPMAARLAIARAQQQLSLEAGIALHTRNFSIINQVGACNLDATLECNGFANAHPHDSHYDQASFVGLAWRPANEHICCEIYSTGRANLPGSKRERDMNESWSRMLPELLRFSSRSDLLEFIPDAQKNVHKTHMHSKPSKQDSKKPHEDFLTSGWTHGAPAEVCNVLGFSSHGNDEFEDADLELLGL